MTTITTDDKLKLKIKVLENDQAFNGILMKQQFEFVKENIKPANIVKNVLNKVITSPDLVENVLGVTISLASGYITKKVIIGTKGNFARKLLGTAIQLGVTTYVGRHRKEIKSSVLGMLKTIRSKTK